MFWACHLNLSTPSRAIMGGHFLRFSALLPSFLLLWLAGCRGADGTALTYLEVVVNLQGASILDPLLLPFVYAKSLSQMDNSDVSVKVCPVETFSADHEGVCGPCSTCQTEQYIAAQCLPWQNRVCSNCTVCGWHEVELCRCDVIDARCFTGDRICVKLVPAALNLTIYMRSVNKELTSIQKSFITSGLQIWYVDWLVSTFDIESASFLSFEYRGNYTYAAIFEVLGVYDSGTLTQLQAGIPSQFQEGFTYSFGLHRRVFSPLTDVYVNGAGTECALPENTCSNMTVFTLSDDSCRAVCMPDPCPLGHYGVYGKCFPCLEGTYKSNVTDGNCTECPENMTSPVGAKSPSQCFVPTTTAAATTSAPIFTSSSSSSAAYSSSVVSTTTAPVFASSSSVVYSSSVASTTIASAWTTVATSSMAGNSLHDATTSSTTSVLGATTTTHILAPLSTATSAVPILTTPLPTEGVITTPAVSAAPTTLQQTFTMAPPPVRVSSTTAADATVTPAPSSGGASLFDSTIMFIAVWGTLGVTVFALCCFGICFACLFAMVLRRLAPRHARALESHFFDVVYSDGEHGLDEIIGFDVEARPVIRCRLYERAHVL